LGFGFSFGFGFRFAFGLGFPFCLVLVLVFVSVFALGFPFCLVLVFVFVFVLVLSDYSMFSYVVLYLLYCIVLFYCISNVQESKSHALLQVAGGKSNARAVELYKKFQFNWAEQYFEIPNDNIMVCDSTFKS
jgi:hypothetical protein